jgi:hypothetical protein
VGPVAVVLATRQALQTAAAAAAVNALVVPAL